LDFIQDLESRISTDDVTRSFQRLIGSYGFTYFWVGCTSLAPDGGDSNKWIAARSNKWFSHWVKHWYRTNSDPSLDEMKRRPRPLRWSQFDGARSVINDSRAFGLEDGLMLGVPLGPGKAMGVSLAAEKYELTVADEFSLELASIYCGLKLAQFEQARPSTNDLLSPRERECLQWVATGKTDWGISEILGISQQTVHKHVSNALRKLGASTRAHAVAVALSARILSP
jgi:LuxR family quorum sensing-dependent transcriptional regulator